MVAVGCNSSDKKAKERAIEANDEPLKNSHYSEAFGSSIDSTLNAYYAMTTAFVNWDSVTVENQSIAFQAGLNGLKLDELKKDTLIYQTATDQIGNVNAELTGLIGEKTLAKKRESLNMVSQNLFDLLRTIRYDRHIIYFDECPMAFDDSKPGNWVSNHPKIQNPYLGLHHPHYGNGMVTCGEVKDSLNFK